MDVSETGDERDPEGEHTDTDWLGCKPVRSVCIYVRILLIYLAFVNNSKTTNFVRENYHENVAVLIL